MIADKQTALLLLTSETNILDHLTEELRNDKDIVLAAIECNRGGERGVIPMGSLPDKFRDDEDAIRLMLNVEPSSFWTASDRLKADREMVLHAVSVWGPNLKYASPELRDDREIVLAALKSSKISLEFASERLQKDGSIISYTKK